MVDDGSTDKTAEIARRFASRGVTVVSTKNGGFCAALNRAYKLSQGDYFQFLDADDLLAPDKIERQLAALTVSDSKRILLFFPRTPFYYRTRHAHFVRNLVWEDLPPVEWLLRKLGENLHMQNANWLVSRELTEAAGPWDEDLNYDQDGDYFASRTPGVRAHPIRARDRNLLTGLPAPTGSATSVTPTRRRNPCCVR